MKMKKILFLSVISLLSLAGCGRTAESSSSEEPKSEPSSSVSESQPAESSSEPESTSVPESSSSEPESIPSSEPAPIVDNEVSVFLLSGQSNMQGPTQSSDYKKADLDNLSRLNIRFFCQDIITSTTPLDHTKNGRWFIPDSTNCSPRAYKKIIVILCLNIQLFFNRLFFFIKMQKLHKRMNKVVAYLRCKYCKTYY